MILRNPFRSLLGFSEILATEIDTLSKEEIVTFSKGLNDDLRNIYGLLDNLLQWSLIQRNIIEHKPKNVNLHARVRAIVFADAHLGLDLRRLGPESLKVAGDEVWLVLPPIAVTVEIRPGETEIIESNLDSAETARLLELARAAFEREVSSDPRLRERARGSAERAIRGLLSGLGFRRVHFVEELPGARTG